MSIDGPSEDFPAQTLTKTVDLDDYRKSILENAALASKLWDGGGGGSPSEEKKSPEEEIRELTDSTIGERKTKLLGELRQSFGKSDGKKIPPKVAPKPATRGKSVMPVSSSPASPPPDVVPLPHQESPPEGQNKPSPPPVPTKPRRQELDLDISPRGNQSKRGGTYSQYIEALTQDSGKIVPHFPEDIADDSDLDPPPTLRPFAPPKPAKRTVNLNFKGDTPTKEETRRVPERRERVEEVKTPTKPPQIPKPHDNTKQFHGNSNGDYGSEPRLSDRNLGLNPRDQEFAELRRQTVKDQIVRAGRFDKWNLADLSPDEEFDGISPHRRIQTLKNLTPAMVQIRHQNLQSGKGRSDPPRGIPWQPERESNPGEQGVGPNRVKSLWEQRIEEHENWKNRSYYPVGPVRRWDSVDALSASLIATRQDPHHFPPLNPRPVKRHLSTHGISHSLDRHKGHPPPRDPLFNQPRDYLQEYLHKGQSLDNLAITNMMIQNQNNWYDAAQIKEAISHESIGNMGTTRNKWEQRIDDNRPPPLGNGHYHQQMPSLTTNGSSSGHLLYSSSSNPQNPHSEEPPPTMGLGRGINLIEKEIQSYREREAEIKQRSTSLPPHRQPDQQMEYRGDQERQKELMLYYLKTRPEVLPSLGVQLPLHLRQTIEGLGHAVPKVELVQFGGQLNGYSQQNGGQYHSNTNAYVVAPPSLNGSAQSTLERQNRAQGESLIAREIREAKEREEELNLSRSQLGLPSLTDILEEWKESGGRMRSARSYDHLHWEEVMAGRPVRDAIKAGSLDRLHRVELAREREPSPPRREKRGRIQEEIEFNLKREESLRRNRGGQTMSLAPQGPSPPPISNPYAGVNVSQRSQYGQDGSLQRRYNLVEIQHDQDFTPVSALTLNRPNKSQRNGGIVGLSHPTDSEISESSSNVSGGEQQVGVRTREYVGQRNPGFKPGHSGEVYGLQQRDDPDEMILAPAGRRKMPPPPWLR